MKLIKYLTLVSLLLAGNAYGACTVSATGISFGPYDVFNAYPLDSTGTISVDCNDSPPPKVSVSIGVSSVSGSFAPRQMQHSSLPEMKMTYNLFTDSSMATVWGDGSPGTATVITQKIKKPDPPVVTTVYARIPAGQNLPVGMYNDLLTITILW